VQLRAGCLPHCQAALGLVGRLPRRTVGKFASAKAVLILKAQIDNIDIIESTFVWAFGLTRDLKGYGKIGFIFSRSQDRALVHRKLNLTPSFRVL
jgi:hypothetical protein